MRVVLDIEISVEGRFIRTQYCDESGIKDYRWENLPWMWPKRGSGTEFQEINLQWGTSLPELIIWREELQIVIPIIIMFY